MKETSTTPPIPAKDTSGGSFVTILVLLAASLGVAAYFYTPVISSKLAQSQDISQKVVILENKVSDLEKRLSELSSNVYHAQQLAEETSTKLIETSQQTSAAFNTDLAVRVQGIETRLAAHNTTLASADMDALKVRIAELEKNNTPALLNTQMQTLLTENRRLQKKLQLAALIENIKTRLIAGAGYAEAWKILSTQANAPLKPFVDALETASVAGVRTSAGLQADFTNATQNWLKNKNAPKHTAGFLDTLKANAAGMVTIRKTGQAHKGVDDEAIVARAEFAAHKGDFITSSKELKTLSPAAQPYFKDWMHAAHAFANTHDALNKLQEKLWQADAQAP